MDFFDLEMQKKIAEKDLSKGDSIWPTCIVQLPNGQKQALSFPFQNNEEKAYNLLKLRRYIQRVHADSYMLVLEVWVSAEQIPTMTENRQEEVLFAVHDGNEETHYNWPITRNDDGTGMLTEPRDNDMANAQGSFADLFDITVFEQLNTTQKRKLDKVIDKMMKTYH
ncbi:hypothetical protein [Moritella sp. F3]|uniref:hypothetical protein n=1 Tax=Moritella sp. F3 TaxID=2718882 RepID=UPI0018E1060E|nr:hypothetical protein [Moritella sp. F3]GIC77160.1 hypothetical protein FMO001_18870 [Moritella sp. F1]GIC82279.1 hypothetical protein FMO003_25600 [Moritella sp. F3]